MKIVEKQLKIVGVHSKAMRDYCYKEGSVVPHHLAQALSANMSNMQNAVENCDKDWARELQNERFYLYIEARKLFGLNMSQMNWLLWEEFKHEITDFKVR